MLWKIYVKRETENGDLWEPLQASKGEIYTYATKAAAMRDADWLYPFEVYGDKILVADETPQAI